MGSARGLAPGARVGQLLPCPRRRRPWVLMLVAESPTAAGGALAAAAARRGTTACTCQGLHARLLPATGTTTSSPTPRTAARQENGALRERCIHARCES